MLLKKLNYIINYKKYQCNPIWDDKIWWDDKICFNGNHSNGWIMYRLSKLNKINMATDIDNKNINGTLGSSTYYKILHQIKK